MSEGRRASVLGAALLVGASTVALADTPKWGPHIDFEGRWGESRALGDIGLFAPLWQNWDSLLFTDLRFKFDDAESLEGNFGLGFRHMLANGWNLGVYGYYDRRRSGTGNTFNQVTLGLEALSVEWDLRANAYLPFGDREQSLGFVTPAPYAELTNGTIEVVTPATSEQMERALTGFDAEFGWRLPLLPVESPAQIRAYAGGFWFDGAGLIEDIYGPRGRVEVSFDEPLGLPGARFTLGAEAQHDKVRGAQGYAMARLRLPLQAPDRVAPPLTPQERRMTERVVRDVDVVTGTHTEQRTPEVREAAINTYNNETVTGAVQVDAAQGHTELQNAIDNLGTGGVVIFNGELTGLTQATQLTAGGTLIGGGAALPVRGATSGTTVNFVAPGAQGTLSGTIAPDPSDISATIKLAPNSVVGGLDIANFDTTAPTRVGVFGQAAAGATVFANRVTAVADGALGILFTDFSHNARALGNDITTPGADSGGIIAAQSNNVAAIGNALRGGGVGIQFGLSHSGTVRGNSIAVAGLAGFGAIDFVFSDNGAATDNTVVTTADNGNGIVFEFSHNAFARGNRIATAGSDAIGVYIRSSDGSTARENVITTAGANAHGIAFEASNSVIAKGNQITTTGNTASGIVFATVSSGTASENVIATTGIGSIGIAFDASSDATASSNTISTKEQSAYGIYFAASANGTASGNVVETNGFDARGIYFDNSANGTASGNSIAIRGDSTAGISFRGSSSGIADNNVISTGGVDDLGIYFESSDGSTASHNRIASSGAGGGGIFAFLSNNGIIDGNLISGTGNTGIGLAIAVATNFTVRDNQFGMIGGTVINALLSSSFTAGSTGNTWTGQGGALCVTDGTLIGSIQFTDTGGGVPGSCP